MEIKTEKAKYKVTVIPLEGALAREGLDEKTRKTATYKGGFILFGYDTQTSREGVRHVRVSPMEKLPTQWIRISERDGSNPIAAITVIEPEPEEQLAAAVEKLAAAVEKLAMK